MSTALPSPEEWKKERRNAIGASEVAAVLGLDKYVSAYDVWELKVGLRDEEPENERMYFGTLLEPVIAEEYARRTGAVLIDPGRYTIQRNPDYPWLACTLDRIIVDPLRGNAVLECKSVGFFSGKAFPSLPHQCQVQAQLAVTGYGWGVLAALIGGQEFRHQEFVRDEEFIAKVLLPRTREFWERFVMTQTPPPRGWPQEEA